MKILGLAAFLLLLGAIVCQNNRQNNAKTGGKSTKKTGGTQGADVSQSSTEVDLSPRSTGSTVATGSSRERGSGNRGAAAAPAGTGSTRTPGQQAEEMRLHFLKNTQVTCNDGTAAGFYLREFRGSRRWLLFLEGGWCCYSKETCDFRFQNIPRLMSSSGWPQTKTGNGIMSSQAEENPHWHNANIVFIPYCSSDVWSGTGPTARSRSREKENDQNANTTEYIFMGSLIIREVIKDLVPKGIKQAKVVMLTGTSAGGTGVLLNIDRVAGQLEQLGAEAQVRGLVDSGWFLQSKQPRSLNCPETVPCSPEDAIKMGLRFWNGVVPNRCRQLYKKGEEWQCFFGHKLYSTMTSPLFVVQWLFDEEQLRVENIYMGSQRMTPEQWQYIQNLGRELKTSLSDVTAVFAPSCLSHTMLTKSNWMTFQVKGTSLPRALQCWDKNLEAARNNRTPARGCPFHLVDTCQWPQCNPTCPALVNQATQQELTLMQMLVALGLDLQSLGVDPQEDVESLVSMVSNGG
ncbi:carboxylesterase notum2 [Eucyclogobius newberryi]|uniref:carboxylesterase notum2 n=1 Tax=Eucyclogobius newberryi TaxID=166745 RepID=UPI003B599337